MTVRQFFDNDTFTYSYLIYDPGVKAACLIDPVSSRRGEYIRLIQELQLNLIYAIDSHIHADHITALGELREIFGCDTLMGKLRQVGCATRGLNDGDRLAIGSLSLQVIFTPGHTDDSFSFLLTGGHLPMLFTGDTLLIRGCGRTDFQNGDSGDLYESLHEKLLTLPDETLVYPAHDYRGWSHSTIGEEKEHNPRLTLGSKAAFIKYMAELDLPDPKYMDVSIPANLQCGQLK